MTTRSITVLLLVASAALLAGCEGPLSSLDPAGPAARSVAWLWWAMAGFATLVLAGLVALWVYAIYHDSGDIPQARAQQIQNRWILTGGIALPVASITLLLGFGIPIGHRMLPLISPGSEPLVIEVQARQWEWRIQYPDLPVTLTNELHMPAGMPVDIHLSTADVIHSFWVPRLAGKLDAIPGRTNVLRLEADEPGVYHGVCTEFCGKGHARMGFRVIVHGAEEFRAWQQQMTHRQEATSDD